MSEHSEYVLEARALTRSFGRNTALSGLDFKLGPGHIVGLLGPNGSGKTTLIKLANGLLTPSSGEILIDGMRPAWKRRRWSLTCQTKSIYPVG